MPASALRSNRTSSTDQEAGKVALGPSATEADAHTFASLRSLQPRVLPFVLSRAAALDAISSGAAAATHY